MNELIHLGLPPVLEALAVSLLHAFWQGLAIGAVLLVFDPVLEAIGTRARHAGSLSALALMLACWLATFVACLPSAATPLPGGNAVTTSALPGLGLLLVAWCAGVLVLSARLLGGWFRLRSLTRRSEPVTGALRRRFEELRHRAGIRRGVRLATSAAAGVPMVVGWLRPIVLLPPALLVGLPAAYVEALLVHELVHVRRLDWLVNVLQSVAETLLFHVPTTWWLAKRLRDERELCCDAESVVLLGDRLTYARALAELEGLRGAHPSLAPSARGGSLVHRLQRLLDPRPASSSRRWLSPVLGVTGLAALASIALAVAPAAPAEESGWLPPAVTRWMPLFEEAGERHGVEPELLAVLTLVESGGDPEARSSRGATGLMQVMPATARGIARKRSLPAPTDEQLADPAYNVDLGAWYLARQLESVGATDPKRRVELAAAAYNGGPKRARAWLAGEAQLSDETLRYKQLVSELWAQRNQASSAAYDDWRSRLHARILGKAQHPLPDARVSSGYRWRRNPTTGQRTFHRGIDLVAPLGTEVRAPLKAEVIFAGPDGDHGNVVVLRHGGGLETRYSHLHEVRVKPGQQLTAGTTLGLVGSTGRSTGPHLHLELRDQGRTVDPAPLLRD